MIHAWQYMGSETENPMGVSAGSMVMGLGFVLSFGYWCTDFLVVQRAMVAKNMSDAERTPIAASIAKMILPFIVIFPAIDRNCAHAKSGGGPTWIFRSMPPARSTTI